jgi:hypothetical protein
MTIQPPLPSRAWTGLALSKQQSSQSLKKDILAWVKLWVFIAIVLTLRAPQSAQLICTLFQIKLWLSPAMMELLHLLWLSIIDELNMTWIFTYQKKKTWLGFLASHRKTLSDHDSVEDTPNCLWFLLCPAYWMKSSLLLEFFLPYTLAQKEDAWT